MSQPAVAAKRSFAVNDPVKNGVQGFLHNSISTSKYNYLTFVPKFFKEQFSKYANIFFLFTACIQVCLYIMFIYPSIADKSSKQIPNVSPTSRFTTIIPLSLVLLASAIKEIMEDYKRHRSDDEVNNRITHRLTGNHFEDIKWKDVQVGDLLRIQNGEFFPAYV
jgi:phospholipid-transporting ATPase